MKFGEDDGRERERERERTAVVAVGERDGLAKVRGAKAVVAKWEKECIKSFL